jgi:hypothetical protein
MPDVKAMDLARNMCLRQSSPPRTPAMMSIRSKWQRLTNWDSQRWSGFPEEGWVQITRTPRQLAEQLRKLPVAAEDGLGANTIAAVAASEID